MNYEFKKMDINHIQEFITWRHEGIYEFYNRNKEESFTYFLNPESFCKYYSVFKDSELVGYFCYNFEEENMVIGLALKPEFTGCGLGYQFVKDGIELGRKTFGHGGSIKLCVANFNERAIKVYKKLGFKEIGQTVLKRIDGEIPATEMRL